MKRFLITTVALLSIVITNASNTTSITTATNASNMERSVAAPAYWSGWVGWANTLRLYIDVYRVPNQCDAFYAVATKYENSRGVVTNINKELVVKSRSHKGDYYVTYEGKDYYFKM